MGREMIQSAVDLQKELDPVEGWCQNSGAFLICSHKYIFVAFIKFLFLNLVLSKFKHCGWHL